MTVFKISSAFTTREKATPLLHTHKHTHTIRIVEYNCNTCKTAFYEDLLGQRQVMVYHSRQFNVFETMKHGEIKVFAQGHSAKKDDVEIK